MGTKINKYTLKVSTIIPKMRHGQNLNDICNNKNRKIQNRN